MDSLKIKVQTTSSKWLAHKFLFKLNSYFINEYKRNKEFILFKPVEEDKKACSYEFESIIIFCDAVINYVRACPLFIKF